MKVGSWSNEISALLNRYHRLPSLSLSQFMHLKWAKTKWKNSKKEAVYEWGRALLSVTRTYDCLCMCACCCFSCVHLFATLWAVAYWGPLSMGFSRQEYWSGLPWLPPEDLPNPGMQPRSLMPPALAGGFFTTSATWKAHQCLKSYYRFMDWLSISLECKLHWRLALSLQCCIPETHK